MPEKRVTIPNINCGHCAASIKRELEEMEGITAVSVDIANKTVLIRWAAPLTWDLIVQTLEEIGYPPEEQIG